MSIIYIAIGVLAFVISAIIYRKVPFERIYINKATEDEWALQKLHDEELQRTIEAKKAEIRARKAKEKEDKNV